MSSGVASPSFVPEMLRTRDVRLALMSLGGVRGVQEQPPGGCLGVRVRAIGLHRGDGPAQAVTPDAPRP